MTNPSKLEQVARAICDSRGFAWENENATEKREWFDAARAAIAAMELPTEEMEPDAWLVPEYCAVIGDGDRAADFVAEGREVIPLYRRAALKEEK